MFAVATNIVMGFAVTGAVDAFGGGANRMAYGCYYMWGIGLVVNTIKAACVLRSYRKKIVWQLRIHKTEG